MLESGALGDIVSAGNRAGCTSASFDHQETFWYPDFDSNEKNGFENALKPFLVPRDVSPESISFGLSGGLDSRVLLALYSAMGGKNPKLHVAIRMILMSSSRSRLHID